MSTLLFCIGILQTVCARDASLKEMPIITASSTSYIQHMDMVTHDEAYKRLCFEHLKYECIMIRGFSDTADPQINGKYCVYQCDDQDPQYPEYVEQDTCQYVIKWGASNYIIYSYSNARSSNDDQTYHIFASSQSCDTNEIALSNLQSCSYWESYDRNNIGHVEDKITIHPYHGTAPTSNLCSDDPVFLGMNTGEIAAIIICVILISVCFFGQAINYWDYGD
eukprot:599203_1